jgi:hypothetical protein
MAKQVGTAGPRTNRAPETAGTAGELLRSISGNRLALKGCSGPGHWWSGAPFLANLEGRTPPLKWVSYPSSRPGE